MAESFDSAEVGPLGYHDFDIGGDANWVLVNFPDFARRFVIQSSAALEIAVRTVNGDGGAAVGADRFWPVVADAPWSQPLARGKGQGIDALFVRDPAGGTATVYLAAEAFEGG